MRGELVIVVAKAAEIDDALHAGAMGSISKGARRVAIGIGERTRRAHRVHEVVGRVAAFERRRARRLITNVAFNNLDGYVESAAETARAASHAANCVTLLQQ